MGDKVIQSGVSTKRDHTKWKLIGPGIVVAATGVGAGDLATSLVAGAEYGLAFLWAVVLGVIVKFALGEGVGRWHLASSQTMLEGWRSMGKWATGYFGVYSIIWGFVYGAAGTASSALAAHALFPQINLIWWAIINGVVCYILVLSGKYGFFEKVMTILVGVMFATVIGCMIFVLPDLLTHLNTLKPVLSENTIIYALGLSGGVGGSITMACYGYWLQEKNWSEKQHVKIMRWDSLSGYMITSIFAIGIMIMGTAVIYGTGLTMEGEDALITFSDQLASVLNPTAQILFLIGFWAASFTSILGVWNGVSYLFADFVRTTRQLNIDKKEISKTKSYKFYVFWLTFPPMILHLFGKPVVLIILYGFLGALFMPFLAVSLIVLLNSTRIEKSFQSGRLSNTVLSLSAILFIVLTCMELYGMIKDFL
ncbi:Nramp family divalent metal transporter [Radiobacillus deserti]|uniref:Divalent metal cation transporter n=1 Tax=Radiobacillus deserti TaxID=2594883 RepID=A0A516KC42_9BACI|nr:Nramp family divalent metal transporter [Radiobacillus deserti]QDP38968.1 divalent metal cation transporter [Radiobacillus deserti]